MRSNTQSVRLWSWPTRPKTSLTLTWSNFKKPVPCTTPTPAQDSQASRIFAEFETNLCRERQLEGIAEAKLAGVYKGRPTSIDASQVRKLKADGMGPSEIAKSLGIGRASVYRRWPIRPAWSDLCIANLHCAISSSSTRGCDEYLPPFLWQQSQAWKHASWNPPNS
jgi:hypothetical protein